MEYVWLIGAVAWFSTALVHKNGPGNIFKLFRAWTFELWGYDLVDGERVEKSPFVCTFCAGPYVLLPLIIINLIAPPIVQIFGILGFAAAVRGLSQEY